MVIKQIRKPRTYKIADKQYVKAKKRANGKLATLVEKWVTWYSEGYWLEPSGDYAIKITTSTKSTNNKSK